jgi:hypothetical protein
MCLYSASSRQETATETIKDFANANSIKLLKKLALISVCSVVQDRKACLAALQKTLGIHSKLLWYRLCSLH